MKKVIDFFLSLFLINESKDMIFCERAPADGAYPTIGTPRIKTGNMKQMQARSLPNHIIFFHLNKAYGAYIIMYF